LHDNQNFRILSSHLAVPAIFLRDLTGLFSGAKFGCPGNPPLAVASIGEHSQWLYRPRGAVEHRRARVPANSLYSTC